MSEVADEVLASVRHAADALQAAADRVPDCDCAHLDPGRMAVGGWGGVGGTRGRGGAQLHLTVQQACGEVLLQMQRLRHEPASL